MKRINPLLTKHKKTLTVSAKYNRQHNERCLKWLCRFAKKISRSFVAATFEILLQK